MKHKAKRPPKIRIPDLKRLLRYRNTEVVARFGKDYGLPARECERIFEDMLRAFWLVAQRDTLGGNIMFMPSFQILDEMWHTFLLFSEDYDRFCRKYFGEMIHHVPAPIRPAKGERTEFTLPELDENVEIIWNVLGASVARRWFDEYPRRYTLRKIRKLMLRAAG